MSATPLPAGQVHMDVLPTRVSHYGQLLDVVRWRKDELAVSNEWIDAVAGLAPGTASKILAPVPTKRMGALWLFLIFGALGLGVAVCEDADALGRVRSRLERRTERNVRVRSSLRMCVMDGDFIRFRGRKGGLARAARMSDRQRSKAARHAARARWSA
jgi:hypothetical protein